MNRNVGITFLLSYVEYRNKQTKGRDIRRSIRKNGGTWEDGSLDKWERLLCKCEGPSSNPQHLLNKLGLALYTWTSVLSGVET